MSSLTSLSLDVFEQLFSRLSALEITRLLFTGDSRMRHALKNAVREYGIEWEGKDFFKVPNLRSSSFSSLKAVYLVHIWDQLNQYVIGNDLSLLPPTLEHIELAFFNAFLFFMENPPIVAKGVDMPSYSNDYIYKSNVATSFPRLKSLKLTGGIGMHESFFASLPSTLEALDVHLTYYPTAFDLAEISLPSSLRSFKTNITFQHKPSKNTFPEGLHELEIGYFPDFSIIEHLPQHLTSLNVDASSDESGHVVDCAILPRHLTRLSLRDPSGCYNWSSMPKGLVHLNLDSESAILIDKSEKEYLLAQVLRLQLPLETLRLSSFSMVPFNALTQLPLTLRSLAISSDHDVDSSSPGDTESTADALSTPLAVHWPPSLTQLELALDFSREQLAALFACDLPVTLRSLHLNLLAILALPVLSQLTRLETLEISVSSEGPSTLRTDVVSQLPGSLTTFSARAKMDCNCLAVLPKGLRSLSVYIAEENVRASQLVQLPTTLTRLILDTTILETETRGLSHLTNLVTLSCSMKLSDDSSQPADFLTFLSPMAQLLTFDITLLPYTVQANFVECLPRSLTSFFVDTDGPCELRNEDMALLPPSVTFARFPFSPHLKNDSYQYLPPKLLFLEPRGDKRLPTWLPRDVSYSDHFVL